MKYIGSLICCVTLVLCSGEAVARSGRLYRPCVEKAQFDKPVIIRPAYKVAIEQPVIGKPEFDEAQFDRLLRESRSRERWARVRNSYEQPIFDNRCDIKKLTATPKSKKQERFVPMEKRFRFNETVAQKATDCDCTAATSVAKLPVN